MADSIPNVDGYEQYLRTRSVDQFSLRAVDAKLVESIMRAQQPKLSCGLDTINNKIVKTSQQS